MVDHPDAPTDIAAMVVAALAVSTAWMEWIDLSEKVVIGALTIALLLIRIRAHLRRE